MFRMNRWISFVFVVLIVTVTTGLALAQNDMTERTRTNVSRVIDEAFNQGMLGVVDEVFTPDYVAHNPDGSTVTGTEAFKDDIASIRAAMPDLQANADPIIVDGEWVAFQFSMTGTFTSEFVAPEQEPIPPTGGPVSLTINIVLRTNEDGQVVEEWDTFDNLSFLTQLGVLPAPENSEAAATEAPVIPAESMTSGMEQAHKDAVVRLVEEFFNTGNEAVGREILSETYVHRNPQGVWDLQGLIGTLKGMRTAMPDFTGTTQAVLAEGDWAAVLFDFTGTFTGELMMPDGSSVSGNGNVVSLPIVILFHFNPEGQIDGAWEQFDNLTFLTQLGLIPAPEAAS